MSSVSRGSIRRTMWIVLCAMAMAAGCNSPSRVTLHQSNAPPSQRHIELSTDQAYFAERGERRQLLVNLPLPGVADGPAAFHVYMDAPRGETPVNPTQAGCARGFLIQTVGDRKGKSTLRSGAIRDDGTFLSPRRRQFTLDALTDDGTRIVAKVNAREAASEVAAFEQRRAADVAMLIQPAAGGEAELSSERSEAVEQGTGTPNPEE